MSLHPQTQALHAGHRADPQTGAVAPPIYFTTSYHYPSTEFATRLFNLEVIGYTYTRTSNPSREVLERRVAAIEGGKAALALASGAAAVGDALLSLAQAGDNIVFDRATLRGGGRALAIQLRRFGLDVRDAAVAEDFVSATDARTRLWFAESLSLPSLERFPIAAVATAGRAIGVPLVIDNSNLPFLVRPVEEGAAVVVYAADTWLTGRGGADGGLLVDAGTFSWESERFPTLHAPDPSYHGAVWTEVVKKWNASPLTARARGGVLRDLGAAISPMAVFQIVQGLETLPLRMRAHAENAARVAEFLAPRPEVTALSVEGGLVGFSLPDAQKFVAALSLISRDGGVGGLRSSVVGSADGRILLSVGVEHADDILDDLKATLNSNQK
ncbi:O-acetylhomoserine aminocarboxypropyltransferase/cysteine synthase [Rhodoblastus acidophilus]|uniref:O-acetylhomoserine aminocarboxypropyltransferase/cysteine synthase n=1 Tax=Rhodoblastus acidophilus TaxID=1074 RepID=A0A6N8DSL7_RHOAC|nr:PLP-dependent transferase [Rhodoblastus acidophilus]MCW2276493.1 O-acetylhomoserine (thiol)-lyase [Rhodoblastus acidophilus]MTV33288.1 O-acetylhomoserine aminocarboxypropyltransferase/cysteine synthase [Rhodoblastus acidophilus]